LRLEQRWKTAGRIYYDYITKNNGPDVNVMTIDSNGNIGVGTNDPSVKLDVNGALRISAGSPSYGKVLMSTDATGLASWVATSTLGLGGGGTGSCSNTAVQTLTNGATYQNTSTNKLIVVVNGSAGTTLAGYIGASTPPSTGVASQSSSAAIKSITFVVPAGYYYRYTATAGTNSGEAWEMCGNGGGGGGSSAPDFETIRAVAVSNNYNIPHGFGSMPQRVEVYYCRNSDPTCAGTNYKIFSERWTAADHGAQIGFDSTNVRIHIGGNSVYLEPEFDGGTGTETSGYYRILAWKNGGASAGAPTFLGNFSGGYVNAGVTVISTTCTAGNVYTIYDTGRAVYDLCICRSANQLACFPG